ncbi:tyrosine-type recombinase/integrase [SAR116 cluster bacterium]|nr:tyrosine-type recombinase/integrase [SAR116 cluster bacterium]
MDLVNELLKQLEGAYAPSTLRGYRNDYGQFASFCKERGESPLPAAPATVVDFLEFRASTVKLSTLEHGATSISTLHRLSGLDDPTRSPLVQICLRKLRRKLGRAQDQAYGITAKLRDAMIKTCDTGPVGRRDAALIHLAYDSMCRASELLALTWQDFAINYEGHDSVIIRRSKTDQEGRGRRAMLTPACTKRVVRWRTALWRTERRLGFTADTFEKSFMLRNVSRHGHIGEGLSAMSLNRILKDRAWRAGQSKSQINRISGHSTRVGSAQDLVKCGATLPQIMLAGGWKSAGTVARYIEHTELNEILELRI